MYKVCSYGNTPLHVAARYGNLEVVNALIAAGANVNAIDANGVTPLHLVTNADIAKALIAAGAEPNAINIRRTTPLHEAILHRNADVVKALIEGRADVNATDCYEKNSLHYVVEDIKSMFNNMKRWYEEEIADIVRVLIAAGVNVNARDNTGKTPLDIAKEGRYNGVAELLTQA